MKRKSVMVLVATLSVMAVTACGTANMNAGNGQKSVEDGNVSAEQGAISGQDDTEHEDKDVENVSVRPMEAKSLDELNDIVTMDLEKNVEALVGEYDSLITEIDTYEKFSAETEKIEEFYINTYEKTRELCIKMREYSLDYARLILDSDGDKNDKYDDFEELYDVVYDDGGELIYDEIYDGILDDSYDAFYNGILDDAFDNVGYDEWSDACSDEYDRWSDARSDVYDEWSDMRSDVYDFFSDMRSEMWDADFAEAEEIFQEFQEEIVKLKEE